MKKLRGSFAAKTTAVVLLSLLAVLCVLAAFGTCYLYDSNAYTRDFEALIGLVSSGSVPVTDMISAEYDYREAASAFEALVHNDGSLEKVLLRDSIDDLRARQPFVNELRRDPRLMEQKLFPRHRRAIRALFPKSRGVFLLHCSVVS